MTLQVELEALRRPLQLAASDRFAGLQKISGLGNALRAAVDRVIALGYADVSAKLAPWRRVLGGFDTLTRDQQAVEVAKGLRLVQGIAGAAPRQKPENREPGTGNGERGMKSLGIPGPRPRFPVPRSLIRWRNRRRP